ncbi:MAG: 50S ribosomal protein L5 [Candidatus Woesearchaeota archaeon]
MENTMRTIRIEKLTLNFGAGKDQSRLDKGIKLIKNITGKSPIKTITQKRIAGWGLRPGLPVGCKLTLRKNPNELIKRLLMAKDNKLTPNNFDDNGNVSFGLHEYIDIPGVKYDPEIGIMGFEVSLTLERPGFRIKRRKIEKKKIPYKHKISKQEAMDYFIKEFNLKIEEE